MSLDDVLQPITKTIRYTSMRKKRCANCNREVLHELAETDTYSASYCLACKFETLVWKKARKGDVRP